MLFFVVNSLNFSKVQRVIALFIRYFVAMLKKTFMWKICTFHLIYNYSLAAWFKVQLEYVSRYSL